MKIIVEKQFEQKREHGGRHELMLESRLETEIDTNLISYEQQNNQKRKHIEVCSMITHYQFNYQLQ